MTVSTKPNRAYPSLPGVGATLSAHSELLKEIRHAIEIHERRTGQPLDSFVRLRELIDLGLLEVRGTEVFAVTEESDDDGDDSVDAEDVTYDNSTSGLSATDVQEAIDELAADLVSGGGGGGSSGAVDIRDVWLMG